MIRLTLLASIIPIVLSGCWNFASLTEEGARDGGLNVDLYMCGTQKTAAREDCANGVDDNQDCLVDCEDPQCADAIRCVDPTSKLLGYGTRTASATVCSGNQTAISLRQDLSLSADCGSNGGCACQANTAWRCNSNIHWADNLNNCNANTFAGNAAVSSPFTGANCTALTAPNPLTTSYYKVDSITSLCPVDSSKTGKLQFTWGTDDKICGIKGCDTLDCVKRAGFSCLAFDGDFATCPKEFPTKINTWVTGVTDNRQCTCSCAGAGGSCAVGATDAQLTDSNTCTGGAQKTQSIAQAMINTCVQAGLSGGNPAATGFSFTPRPQCAAAGTASTDLPGETAAGRVIQTGSVTTCCTP